MESLKEIQNALQKHTADIKAEVMVASLYEKGILAEQIIIRNQGVFKRSYRKDIVDCEIKEINSFEEILEIGISRDGLYDILPEGLFHQSERGSNQSVQRMVEEHKKFKSEELVARKYFQPFENEFFKQKVQVEENEKNFYYRILSEKNQLLQQFWKLDSNLPLEASKRLLEFLPRAGKICGHIQLMQLALSKILLEEVKVLTYQMPLSMICQDKMKSTQAQTLGIDSVMGATYEETIPVIEFMIGPCQSLSVEQFLPKNPYYLLLQKFYDCFTPLEAEIKTTFVTNKNQVEKENSPILGYNFDL